MKAPSPLLLDRLRELALVEVDTLVGRLEPEVARDVAGAFVGDLEDALSQARATIREAHVELGGLDPLLLVDLGPERRCSQGDAAIAESSRKLALRAAARREVAQLEELVRLVLPRLLEADRRFMGLGGDRY